MTKSARKMENRKYEGHVLKNLSRRGFYGYKNAHINEKKKVKTSKNIFKEINKQKNKQIKK